MKSRRPDGDERHLPGAPPLAVWGWVAALLLVALAVSLPAYQRFRAEHAARLLTANRTRIDSFFADAAAGRRDVPLVAAAGTSLLFRGTYLDGTMEQFVRAPGEAEFRYLRITAVHARFPHYRQLLEELVDRHPDLLILQSDLGYDPPGPGEFSEFLRTTATAALRRVKQAVLGRGKERGPGSGPRNWVEDRFEKPGAQPDPRELQRFDRYRLTLLQQARHGSSGGLRDILDRATAARVRTVLLVMPRSPAAEAVKDEHFRALEDEFLAGLQRDYGAVVLRCPLVFSPGEFFDHGHLNEAGRQRFARWLATAVRQLLASGGNR